MSLSGGEGYNSNEDASDNAEQHKVEEEQDRDADLEAQEEEDTAAGGSGFKDLPLHGRRLSFRRLHTRSTLYPPPPPPHGNHSAPPEWALLVIGCLLGLATGLFVAAFNNGQSGSPRRQGFDLLSGIFPMIKVIQAAVTLGTGCSLGPEGPSVDIGKSCANGFSFMMENNRERKIALLAAGAAPGISSGFNAAVAGCFFAIETVLRPLHAENSPPITTAMIILASVISSTVSNVLLGTQSAFVVPTYDLKSAAELPLYLILGMLCGAVSVAFTRLVAWFTKSFETIKEKFGLPTIACPVLGGFGAGIIALKYPGILYWGFTNVEEILHTGKTASAPGIWLLSQLSAAKVVATALCKGSGLVGGLYAPSLMIGAAVGAVFGGSAAELINTAIPGNAAVAQPEAYALGAVGLAIWVPSVTNQLKETEAPDARSSARGYSSLLPAEDKDEVSWSQIDDGDDLEFSKIKMNAGFEAISEDTLLEDLKVSQAMSKNYVKVSLVMTLNEAIKCFHDNQQNCVLVVDDEDFLDGILTYGDVRRYLSKMPGDVSNTRFLDVCGDERKISWLSGLYLAIAKELMEAKGIKQLPVVKRGRERLKERKRRIVAVLHYDSISQCLRSLSVHCREEMNRRKSIRQHRKENNHKEIISCPLVQ
ncbi:hypothetical protein FNV43_RR03670 [Rhamnella rubrinervis]|uniref:Chloride channel protein n=1 Tax=Rhamnella rubrinervis TaxID=2594499 RepID=A0A8K0MPU9_9ROSA|nr:hypothetical protein FNV43_RR03670 [Rhamnella rubrinervis]